MLNHSNISQSNARSRRLLNDQFGECRDEDITERLAELRTLYASVPEEFSDDLRALKALSTDTRYRIVRLLHAADSKLCVCEITPLLDVSDSAISHALSDLMDAGLVTRRKDGTRHYYKVTDRTDHLINALDASRRDDP